MVSHEFCSPFLWCSTKSPLISHPWIVFQRIVITILFRIVERLVFSVKSFSRNFYREIDFTENFFFIIFDNYYTTYTSISLLVCVFSLFGFDSMMIDSSNAWPEMKGEEDVYRFDVWAHQSRKLALRPRRILGQKLGLLFAMHMYKLYSYYVPT